MKLIKTVEDIKAQVRLEDLSLQKNTFECYCGHRCYFSIIILTLGPLRSHFLAICNVLILPTSSLSRNGQISHRAVDFGDVGVVCVAFIVKLISNDTLARFPVLYAVKVVVKVVCID